MNYIVTTFSKTNHLIGSEQEIRLRGASPDDMVRLSNGSQIKVSNICEILPENIFYEMFPDKRPQEEVKTFVALPAPPKEEYSKSRVIMLEAIVTGLEKYLRRYKGSKKSNCVELLKTANNNLELVKNNNGFDQQPIKVMGVSIM